MPCKFELDLEKKLEFECCNKIFVCVFVFHFLYLKSDFRNSSWSFGRLSWGRITDKLVVTGKIYLCFNCSTLA